jgi:two-component system, OmpR family, phosphate regulon sensor histidine kinase PhoR
MPTLAAPQANAPDAAQARRLPGSAMREAVRTELALVLGFVLSGLSLRLLGLPWRVVWPAALLPYLARNLYYLLHLFTLIRRRHRLAPPFPRGLWGEIYRTIAQYQARRRKWRKRQVRFTRRFREAANAVPDALVVLDRLQRIEWANPAAATLLDVHWPRDDGRPLTEVLGQAELAPLIEAGDYSQPTNFTPLHNRALMLAVRVTPFGERKRQRLVVARDTTKVYHLNMIRRDFVANASHELRTPLTVIAGFLENLADAPTTPSTHRRPLDLMRKQSERMRTIIEDLLTLSRLEMDEHPADLAAVDVPEELRLILNEAHALSGGTHRFEVEIDPELMLLGNALELRSAFSNLIYNAVKHTRPGTLVRVAWCREPQGPILSVQDDGEGIAPEHIPRLTERFYRVDKARSRESGGTGLGLAIVKHVLNRHDARLVIASEPGRGSTFACRFPPGSAIYEDQATAARPKPRASAGS